MKGTPTCLLCIYFLVGRKLVNMEEIWKDIKGYEGLYRVSNLGRVKSLKKRVNFYSGLYKEIKQRTYRERIINLRKTNRGYMVVELYKNGIGKRFSIHRLVAENFIKNSNNLPQVNHIDGNKENNNINNLEWCTGSQNIKHAIKTGLFKAKKRPVIQYDLNGNYIKKWDTIKDFLIEKNINLKSSAITKCCKGKRKSAYGYKWKYAE